MSVMGFLRKLKKFHMLAAALGLLILVPVVVLIFNFSKDFEEPHEKIGFIITGNIHTPGWNGSHYDGIKKACDKFGVELLVKDNVRENSGRCVEAIHELVQEGAGMIFLASYGYPMEVQNIIAAYPNVAFATISAEVHVRNLASYFVRMYQARYLSGALAGMKTKTNVIGYVAAMSNTEVNRGINAFALGVKRVNPDAKVVVMWTGDWNDESTEMFHAERLIKEAGADVLTYHQNEDAAGIVAERLGTDFIGYNAILNGYSEHYLTSVICRWDLYYADIIQRYLKDEINSVKNHWLGMEKSASSSVVTLSTYSKSVNPEMVARLSVLEQELINNRLIFSGEIYDNQGNLRCREGEAISDNKLLEDMNWLVEGVEVLE